MLAHPTTTRGLALALVLALGSAAVAAQDKPRNAAAAEALFQQGRALLMDGKIDQACPKLEESQRLDPATGTLMAVALCHEQQGKLASAWAAFADIEARSRLDGRADREQTAREHGAALRPRLSSLTLQVADEAAAAPGFGISIDGVAIGRGAWNTIIPIDGGEHVVDAAAPGKKKWSTVVSVKPERDYARVDVPVLASQIDLSALPAERTSPPIAPPGDAGPAGAAGIDRRTIAIVVAGAGLVALGAASYLALDAKRSYDHALVDCQGTVCPPGPLQQAQDARSQGDRATWISVAGAVAIASGAGLWLTARRGAPEPANVSASARGPRLDRLALHPQGVVVGGRF